MELNTDYKKIIFIDDDTALVSIYSSILKQKNLSDYFIHFDSAQKGIEYLDGITSDENLPDYLRYFDKSKKLKDSVEVFVCSSSQKQEDRNKVMRYPFVSAYLEKPLSSDFLELLIEDSVESA